jgi:fibronectin type 3 domain-containing protein
LTPDLLLAPAFRDMPVVLGHHYFYRVTAVDRAGNESEPGNPEALQPQQNP